VFGRVVERWLGEDGKRRGGDVREDAADERLRMLV
jgi:hypothetical protein